MLRAVAQGPKSLTESVHLAYFLLSLISVVIYALLKDLDVSDTFDGKNLSKERIKRHKIFMGNMREYGKQTSPNIFQLRDC